jgi:iron(III) transport system substrate-binding protein
MPRALLAVAVLAVTLTGCGDDASPTVFIYTSVTQGTVDAVVDAYRAGHPDAAIEVFRAPTGEVNARLAAERRDGDIQADVLWLTDPLSMQQYDADGLLAEWSPAEAEAVPAQFRTSTFWGTRQLNMVVVQQQGLQPPITAWSDLTDPAYAAGIAIPDPGFAGSAFGALGYFSLAPGFGTAFYEALDDNGAVQVSSPGDVVSGVAEGRFLAGMTLDFSARTAIADGSPIEIVWPEPGAVAMYSPIAVFDSSDAANDARSFANFVLTPEAQALIAGTGWQPIRPDVAWSEGGPTVAPDWTAIFDRQAELLEQYRAIFGG